MTNKLFNQAIFLLVFSMCLIVTTGCKNDVSMKKQQKAFHVDADGNLLNKKGEVVKTAGEFKLEGGYYVDNDGERIKRKIDETKEKINESLDKTKEKMSDAASKTKEAVSDAASKTKDAVSNVASLTKEKATVTFKNMFNTKAVGETYTLSEITFDPESHRITNMSKAEVEGLAAALKDLPASRIQVQAHTTDGKNNKESKEISKLRAQVVKDMLVTLGVSADQVSAKGMGLTNEDAAKALANKVEIIVEE